MAKFTIKLILFLTLLACCHTLVYLYFEKPFPKFNKMLAAAVKNDMDIAYMADSTTFHVLAEDDNQANTVEMLQRYYPDISISAFLHPAFDLNMYEHILDYIIRHTSCEVVIMPVNLRSFSSYWDRNPMYEFRNEKIVMRYGDKGWFRTFYKPLAVFKAFQPQKKEHHYKNAKVYRGQEVVGRIRDFDLAYATTEDKKDFFAEKFMVFYMYPLSEEHRKIQALAAIKRKAQQHGVKILFYITPIDYQKGEEYAGPDFGTQVEANVQFLLRFARQHNILLLDLSRALEADHFYWERDKEVL
jgi:hypothetical protein